MLHDLRVAAFSEFAVSAGAGTTETMSLPSISLGGVSMSALGAFYSTWSNARQTFGEGTPQDGSQFDASSKFQQAKAAVEAAAPGASWQGAASEAYGAKNKDHAAVFGKLADLDRRMAAEVTNAANVVTAGRQKLDEVKNWVTRMVGSIPSGTSATDKDTKLLQIANAGISKVSNILQTSTGEMNAIGGRVRGVKGEFQALGNEKLAPGAEQQGGKKDGEETDALSAWQQREDGELKPEDMEALVRDALDGNEGAAAHVDKILDSIDGEQLGSKSVAHPLSPLQAELVGQMQAQMKHMSISDLNAARDKLGSHKDILVNAMQIMSDKDVRYPRHDGDGPQIVTPGRLPNDGVLPGDSGALPDAVQRALSNSDSTQLAGMPGPDGSSAPVSLRHADDLKAIAGLVKDGDPKFQTGTELDRQIMLAADRIMDTRENPLGDPPVDYRETTQSLFEAVDNDHQIINDHLMGRNGVDAKDFLNDVNTIDWTDNGKAAGYLFSWTNEDSPIAAETADKYAEYLGEKRPQLMNIDGQTLGQLNPELVQGYARGLTPYVDEMSGASNPFFEIDDEASRRAGLMPNAKGVFAVLNTDAGAADTINTVAYQEAMKHETAFAMSPGDPQSHSHMTAAATMRGLVDVGAHEAFQSFQENGYAADKTETQWKKSGFDAAVAAVSTGGTLIPNVGFVAGPVISQVGNVFSQELFDAPSTPVKESLPQMSESVVNGVLLDAMLAARHPVNLPQGYIDWESDPPHVSKPGDVNDWDYEAVINAEIGRQTAVVDGDGPDEIYAERYNLVIQDPDIQKHRRLDEKDEGR